MQTGFSTAFVYHLVHYEVPVLLGGVCVLVISGAGAMCNSLFDW